MKYLFAAAALSLAMPALAMGPMNTMTAPQPMQAQLKSDTLKQDRRGEKIRSELIQLRDEGLKLRAADGGTLSDEHRAYLQQKLDAIRTEERSGE
jgi:hypothetical protein